MLERLISCCRRRVIDRPRVLFFVLQQAITPTRREDLLIDFPDFPQLCQQLQACRDAPQQIDLYAQRFSAGDWPCTVYRDGELVHLSWAGYRQQGIVADYELGACGNWPLPSPAGLIFDCWTSARARGLGIYPHVLTILGQQLLEQTASVWIYCLQQNSASRRGIEKAGFRLQGQRQAWRLFGRFFACGS